MQWKNEEWDRGSGFCVVTGTSLFVAALFKEAQRSCCVWSVSRWNQDASTSKHKPTLSYILHIHNTLHSADLEIVLFINNNFNIFLILAKLNQYKMDCRSQIGQIWGSISGEKVRHFVSKLWNDKHFQVANSFTSGIIQRPQRHRSEIFAVSEFVHEFFIALCLNDSHFSQSEQALCCELFHANKTFQLLWKVHLAVGESVKGHSTGKQGALFKLQ